jgi:hypothetical protein
VRRRLSFLAASLVAAAALGAGAAWAASLLVSAKPLTVFAACLLRASSSDAYVVQNNAGTNFGTATTMRVRSQSGNRNRRTFVRFDLAGCNATSAATVTGASLDLYMSAAPAASRTYEARRVSAAWVENGITWTNQPAVGAVTSSTVTGTTSGVRLSWTVTTDVQSWLAGSATNAGHRISDETEGSAPFREATFRTREWGTALQRPRLTILYYPQ